MIKNTCIVTLSLLILYMLFIRIVDPWWNTSQNSQQQNIIKAQKYLYQNNTSRQNIIIGSSLSFRLKGDKLKGYTNLSMLGMGISEPLQIISQGKNLPDTLFVEMNVAFKQENTAFLDRLYQPLLFRIKDKAPVLQAENQPVGVAGSLLKHFVISKVLKRIEKLYSSEENREQFQHYMLDELIEEQVKNYIRVPDKEFLDNHFSKLRTYVNILKAKGVKIVFFEMPVNCKLSELPMAITTREYFNRFFPQDRNLYIPLPDCDDYITTDGVHLTANEASIYTYFFKARTRELKYVN